MADLNIQLPLLDAASLINDSDLLHIRQGATDKRIDFSIVKANVLSNIISATETQQGVVELATPAETVAGLSDTLATHPAGVKALIQDMLNNIRGGDWPIGSIYYNGAVATNPATLLGFGTWEQYGKGRVVISQDNTDALFTTIGQTGGSKNTVVVSHNHTADTTGQHTHSLNVYGYRFSTADFNDRISSNDNGGARNKIKSDDAFADNNGEHTHTISTTGESGVNKNLQPYIVAYAWIRTA